MIALETEMHTQMHSSGNGQENNRRYVCSPILHIGLFSGEPFYIILC